MSKAEFGLSEVASEFSSGVLGNTILNWVVARIPHHQKALGQIGYFKAVNLGAPRLTNYQDPRS